MSDVTQTLQELSGVFDRMGLEYVVIGGIAVRAYAIPRPTFDIDFTVAIPRDRLFELFRDTERLGYSVAESYQQGWVDTVAKMPLVKIRCYLQGQGVDVDIFLAENAFQRAMLERRQLVETGDGTVWIASPEDVILLKLLASRPRDLLDVQDILFTQGELDRPYMFRWADQLDLNDHLKAALRKADEQI
ncbi:MAG: nucleotidyltransferase [Planctomycetaceae bacterium]|nr:nucleotidyltransferase [Planctomycetaceae bacterium]